MIYLAIYLIGGIFTYLLSRYQVRKYYSPWTKQDRIFGLSIACASWIGFIAVVITFLLEKFENNEEAEW